MIVAILMGTNCAHILDKFLQVLLKKTKRSLSCLHFTFCNIEDAFSLIDSKFGDYVDASISSEIPWI